MNDYTVPIVIAVIASLPGLVALLMQARKIRAEAADHNAEAAESVSSAAQALIDPLARRVVELETVNEELKGRLDMLKLYVDYLLGIINGLVGQSVLRGQQPVNRPMSLSEFRVQRVQHAND